MNDKFLTAHYSLAQTLLHLGATLTDVSVNERGHRLFTFTETPDKSVQKLADQYFSAEGIRVNARELLNKGNVLRKKLRECREA